jgi:hypothetical protein
MMQNKSKWCFYLIIHAATPKTAGLDLSDKNPSPTFLDKLNINRNKKDMESFRTEIEDRL